MARKLKGKNVGKKGLKGALARHVVMEDVKKKNQKSLEATIENKKLKDKSIKGKHNKQKVQSSQKSLIPFLFDDKVLLVGEGDFSYAVSIVKQNYINPSNLIATSFDSYEELIEKYKGVEEKLEFLKAEGVKVLHEVDATKLVPSFKLDTKKGKANSMFKHSNLNYIMFNFPHTGRGMKDMERNIKDHQKLVLGYFESCKELLNIVNDESNSDFSGYGVNNVNGKIVLSLFEGEPYNSWSVKILARSINYKVERSGKFDWTAFPEYHHKRTTSGVRDTTKPAAERDARIYIFEEFVKKENKKKDDSDDDSD